MVACDQALLHCGLRDQPSEVLTFAQQLWAGWVTLLGHYPGRRVDVTHQSPALTLRCTSSLALHWQQGRSFTGLRLKMQHAVDADVELVCALMRLATWFAANHQSLALVAVGGSDSAPLVQRLAEEDAWGGVDPAETWALGCPFNRPSARLALWPAQIMQLQESSAPAPGLDSAEQCC